MDEWLGADDVRKAVEDAREEMYCIAYGVELAEGIEGDEVVSEAFQNALDIE